MTSVIPAPAAVLVALAQRVWFFAAEFLALSTFALLPARNGKGADGGAPGNRKLMEVL